MTNRVIKWALFSTLALANRPLLAETDDFEANEVDSLIQDVDSYFQYRTEQEETAREDADTLQQLLQMGADDVVRPADNDPSFPIDPVDRPIDSDYSMYPYGSTTTKRGVADKIAMEVLFKTLEFYGVKHIMKKVNTRIDFKIIESRSGYFADITKLDVAYAVREFSRYLSAMMCNNVTHENVYRMFAQVPAEEIGLRFKYDMAWALFGNALPKEPNQVMLLGTRWGALEKLIGGVRVFDTGDKEKNAALKSWASSITDVVKILGTLNKLMCYVDIRPNPKEELKKRVVVKKLLDLDKAMNDKYSEYEEMLNQVEEEGRQAKMDSLLDDAPKKKAAPKADSDSQ